MDGVITTTKALSIAQGFFVVKKYSVLYLHKIDCWGVALAFFLGVPPTVSVRLSQSSPPKRPLPR
jgi:hypothetical protein